MDEKTAASQTEIALNEHARSVVEMEIKPEPPDSKPPDSKTPDSKTPDSKTVANQPCADQPLASRIEALLLGSDRPLPENRMAELLGLAGAGTTKTIREAIDLLNTAYKDRSFRIEKLAGGWQILTLPQFGPLMARLHTDRQSSKLSHAALETMSIIAYRQPIIRAEIEAIRGVACGEVLRGLLERRLIKIVGRAEELGRPMLYGTTKEFLKTFGLARIDDLPEVEGLNPPSLKKAEPKKESKTELKSDHTATSAPEGEPNTAPESADSEADATERDGED